MPQTQHQRLIFYSVQHLRAWLQGHPVGKDLLRNEVENAIETRCRDCDKPRVLVVIDGSGDVDVYGGNHVRVHIAERPYICGRESENWAVARRVGDEYLDCMLPRVFAEMFYPGNLRGIGFVRQVTPEMIENRNRELAILKGLRENR